MCLTIAYLIASLDNYNNIYTMSCILYIVL